IVTRGEEDVTVDTTKLWCDAAAFAELLSGQKLEQALELYQGDAFPGLFIPDAPSFEQWIENTRATLCARAADAALRLAARERENGNRDAAVGWYRRAAELSPADETPIRAAIELLDQAGNRGAAVTVYEEFAARLRKDYELEPSPETSAFIEHVRNRSDIINRAAAVPTRPAASDSVLVAQPLESVTPGSHLSKSSLRKSLMATAAGLLLTLSLAGWVAWQRWGSEPAAPAASVAVLPFVDMSASRGQQYLSDGMTEELITALSKVDGLLVPARTSSFVFKDKLGEISSIARQLGVAHVLEGSVRRDGDRVRVTAQLIDARSGYHLWSENYDRKLDDLFQVQDEIAAAIAGTLKLRLISLSDREPVAKPYVADAYELYLQGRYQWHQRNKEGVTKAIEYLSAAVERDPGYAAAYAALADAYQLAPTFASIAPDSAFPMARAAALTAIRLDSMLAEPHASLGYIRMHWERDWRGAEASLRRAIQLNPGYATAYQWLRLNLLARGRGTEALAAALRAQRLDPLSTSIQAAVADTYFYTRQYDMAIPAYRRTLELDPKFARARTGLARAYMYAGRTQAALHELHAALPDLRDNSYYTGVVGSMAGVLNRTDQAHEMLAHLRTESQRHYVPAYAFALVHAGLAEADSALHWLQQAVDQRDNWTTFIPVEPAFDALRMRTEYKRILAQLGLS
ncbi:MAG: tetratricopeptide repeat protein, partial [Gemmatimonadota bacterium]